MRKIFILFLIIIMLFCGCTGTSVTTTSTFEPPKGMTAEETVKKFFEYWNEKDFTKTNSLMAEQYDGLIISGHRMTHFTYDPLDRFYFKSVKLLDIEKDTHEPWDSSWGKKPYAFATIPVSFDFRYREWLAGGYYGWENGVNSCSYCLIKENKNSDWRILEWGNG